MVHVGAVREGGLAGGDVWDEFLQLCLRLTRSAAPTRR